MLESSALSMLLNVTFNVAKRDAYYDDGRQGARNKTLKGQAAAPSTADRDRPQDAERTLGFLFILGNDGLAAGTMHVATIRVMWPTAELSVFLWENVAALPAPVEVAAHAPPR